MSRWPEPWYFKLRFERALVAMDVNPHQSCPERVVRD